MSTLQLLEGLAGFTAACLALWFLRLNRSDLDASRAGSLAPAPGPLTRLVQRPATRTLLRRYVLERGALADAGLLILRVAVGLMMIHHGQDKLANPQAFADTYVAPLHLPFPLVLAWVAGLSEVAGSWLLILGLLTPLGALAIAGTMGVAAYHHILTAGLNIYVLELVVLYLGGSLGLLLLGPGRLSFDGAISADLVRDREDANDPAETVSASLASAPLAPSGGI
ncbi:DoxX family protein [Cyanobium sp. NIES-981]|uniref:DoxX family protein n=1 Tax=Cyanobium sp. NIES-981 TaxID=1851505 RepID=UPI000B35AE45